ncbi:MAG: type II toxin-antitoxin system VapC family toxin [Bacteroidota bacterium]
MNRYVIDTQSFIWHAEGNKKLSQKARRIIESLDVRLISYASIWEMVIKVGTGKLAFNDPVDVAIEHQIRVTQYKLLPIERLHIYHLKQLPLHHKDPFDRLIIAQAIIENIPVVSADTVFDLYPVQRIW